MSDSTKNDRGQGGGGPPVDPSSVRAMLMLETASHMMAERDWEFREARVSLRSQGGEQGAFTLYGANHPDSVRAVFERAVDISILNPSCVLRMGHRGVGLFERPMQVATVGVIPHYDQLGFAVTEASRVRSLDEVRERRFPLRLSVRGSLDLCAQRTVELVLRAHGFTYADLASWGGSVSYDQPMPNDGSRLGRVQAGELDAIFDEGIVLWADKIAGAGMRFLPIAGERMTELERQGLTAGVIERSRYPTLPCDVPTVDFSGWPIYCRVDTAPSLVRKFCEALEARRGTIPWHIGPRQQEPIPLERLVRHAPDTPLDVPFHAAAAAYWESRGLDVQPFA